VGAAGTEVDVAALSREELEEHALALHTVLSVAEAVHRSSDFEDLVERSVDAIVTYTRFPSVGLFRVNRAAARVELVAIRGFGDEVKERVKTLPLDGSLTGHAVKTGTVVTTHDLGADARLEPRTQEALKKEGFVEVASVPIFFRDEVIGALNLIYKHAANLSAHERATLLTLGKTLGVAMQNRIDAAKRRELEEHVRRAEQLESLGVFAAGVAHDFNNLLVGVIGNVTHARELTADPNARDALSEAEHAAQRAQALAQQLLTFSRGGAPVARPTAGVFGIVRAAATLGARGLDVRCVVHAPPEEVVLEIDGAQLAQVVQNLVRNAAEASPPGGEVAVTVARAPSGLLVTVHDEGAGIPEAARPHVFEPYFSTKPGASGLGLAIVASIVGRYGGSLDVASAAGAGTTFTVRLPARDAVLTTNPSAATTSLVGVRVLVVDDEPAVRSVTRRILTRGGARVDEAADGDEAVARFTAARDAGPAVDCVILDLTLAGGELGTAVLARLKELAPGLRAIASSGYADDAAMAHHTEHGFSAVLPKPYTAAELRDAVLAALARDPPTA
jgi:signal transduction histidine kinase/ActR/RegA family two-component response regulator